MGFLTLKLGHNQTIPQPFQYNGYKVSCTWPLEEKSPKWKFMLQKIGVTLTSLILFLTIWAEWTFIAKTANDIASLTEAIGTALEGTHILIRIILFATRQAKMREMYRRFYQDIYISNNKKTKSKSFEGLEYYMRLMDHISRIYGMATACTIGVFIAEAATFDLHANNKPFIFQTTFEWYDQQDPLPYIITAILTTWMLFGMICLMAADDFTISMMLCHTSYRFKQIQEDLENLYDDSLAAVPLGKAEAEEVHKAFRLKLNAILKRQQQLISFITEANEYFTYTLFFSLTFATLCICVIIFQFQKTLAGLLWAKYALWSGAKILHIVFIGYFGQMLTDSASELQNSFYNCGWEKLAEYGTTLKNKELMGDIRLGIMNAQKDVVIVGLKFIPVSHGYVGTALRSAMSYFMFLNTMDKLTNTN